jgi:hypothetical protein
MESKEKSIIRDIVDDLKLSNKFVFTFGTGIGAFLRPVKTLLEGSGLQMSDNEVILLIITAIAIILNESNAKEAIKKVKEKGLIKHLKSVVDFIKNTSELINTFLKRIADASYGLADILGFTFLLVPSMKIINELIDGYGLSTDSYKQFAIGFFSAMGTYGVKSIIKKIRTRL